MNPEQHRSVRELLGAYVLGKLPDDEAVSLRAHVDGCPTCQAELQELAPLAVALRGVDLERVDARATPAPDLGDRIVQQVRRSERESRRRRDVRGGLSAALVAAAVLAAFVLGARLGLPGQETIGSVTSAGAPVEEIDVETVSQGVDATAGLVTHTWGTEIQIIISGLEPGGVYSVDFLEDDGTLVPAGTFLGTGADSVRCSLNAALPRDRAARVVVTDISGAVVVQADSI